MLARLKIAHKLYLMTGLTLAFLLIAAMIGFVGAMKLGDLFKTYRATSSAQMLVSNIAEDFLQARLGALKYRAQADPEQAQAVESNLAEIRELRAATDEIIQDADTKAMLVNLKAEMQRYGGAFTEVVGAGPAKTAEIFANQLDVIGPRVANELDSIQDRLQATQKTIGPEAEQSVVWTEITILVVSVIAVFLSAVAALIISRAIAGPIGRLTAVMTGIAETERTDVGVPSQSDRDEVGDMARALETFRGKLEEKARMEAEQAERDHQAKAEKRQAMLDMADRFEAQVGRVVDGVSSAAT